MILCSEDDSYYYQNIGLNNLPVKYKLIAPWKKQLYYKNNSKYIWRQGGKDLKNILINQEAKAKMGRFIESD